MRVSELHIYPVKSLGGISLQQSPVTARGLAHDRCYMLVDRNNRFISQRSHPVLALFRLALTASGFSVDFGSQRLPLPFTMSGPMETVSIWEDEAQTVLAPSLCHEWFSDMLGEAVRLVYMPDSTQRFVDRRYAANNETVSFADGYPLLLISQASLDLLNEKLAVPLGMDRFRPNIVINGTRPHAEDEMDAFRINDAVFKRVKPCARCVITTINQQTGEKMREPLATLATYRQHDHKILFGQNVLCLEEGVISVADIVY